VGDSAPLLVALAEYRTARRRFLEVLGCAPSNRDPLAEFAERLVHAVLGGELAANRVQKAYDLVTAAGETVQVRYLANPAERWVNGHVVDFRSGVDLYALLVVEDLDAEALVVFTRSGVPDLCTAFAKRHAHAGTTFQFLEANFRAIAAAPARYQALGLTFVDLKSSRLNGPTNATFPD
jgi:hypothetical protein